MTHQFDVVINPLRSRRADVPYLLCVQHHLLDHLTTRLIAPLRSEKPAAPNRLCPALKVDRDTVFLDPTDLYAAPVRMLGDPIANLDADRDRIVAALDLVFTGI